MNHSDIYCDLKLKKMSSRVRAPKKMKIICGQYIMTMTMTMTMRTSVCQNYCRMCITPLAGKNIDMDDLFPDVCRRNSCLELDNTLLIETLPCWGDNGCKNKRVSTTKIVECYLCTRKYSDCGEHLSEYFAHFNYICHNCRRRRPY